MNNGLTTACLVLLNQLKQSVQKHPKRITAAVATLLLTGGGGAFAVASFAPDPADLPVRTVTQAVQSLAADEPLSSLVDIPQYALYRSDVTRSADTAESILQRLGVADPAASAFLRSDANVRQNLLGRTGRSMSAETTDDHRLTRLTARWAPDDSESFKRLVVERQQDGSFASRIETAPLTVGSRLAGGIIRSSLFAATDAANIPDAVAVQRVGRLRGVCAADRLVTGGAQAGADDLIQAGVIFHNEHTNHVNPPSQHRKAGILGAFRCIRH